MIEEKPPTSKGIKFRKTTPLKERNQKIRAFSDIDKIHLEGANTYL